MTSVDTDILESSYIEACRSGDAGAIVRLYSEHWPAALGFARGLVRTLHDAEDITATAFLKTLTALRPGAGPRGPFRPYLFRAVHTAAADHLAKNAVEPPIGTIEETAHHDRDLERILDLDALDLAGRAFSALPQRWQRIIWHIDVEGLKPRDVAPLMGLEPNAVSALIKRARTGLREAYLTAYALQSPANPCNDMLRMLTRTSTGTASPGDRLTVTRHTRHCRDCRAVLTGLTRISSTMRTILSPLVVSPFLAHLLRTGIFDTIPAPENCPLVQAWDEYTAAVARGIGQGTKVAAAVVTAAATAL